MALDLILIILWIALGFFNGLVAVEKKDIISGILSVVWFLCVVLKFIQLY